MVHLNVPPGPPRPEIALLPCQHAYVLVGDGTIFGVHQTQFWAEEHKYQQILRLDLEAPVLEELRRQRARHPDATFVFCNDHDHAFAVPEMSCGPRADGSPREMTGDIFFGIRPPPDPLPEGFFPWSRDRVLPMIAGVTARIAHSVLFVPFVHNQEPPERANYLLWGRGDEAHMTRLQTARRISDAFDAPVYGIDVDHVMSLAGRPDWISPGILESGVPFSLPALPRRSPDGRMAIREAPPFGPGDRVTVLHRGEGAPRTVTAGQTWLWGGAVCNSETDPPFAGTSLLMTETPRRYWVT
jgi:hypothetical protein